VRVGGDNTSARALMATCGGRDIAVGASTRPTGSPARAARASPTAGHPSLRLAGRQGRAGPGSNSRPHVRRRGLPRFTIQSRVRLSCGLVAGTARNRIATKAATPAKAAAAGTARAPSIVRRCREHPRPRAAASQGTQVHGATSPTALLQGCRAAARHEGAATPRCASGRGSPPGCGDTRRCTPVHEHQAAASPAATPRVSLRRPAALLRSHASRARQRRHEDGRERRQVARPASSPTPRTGTPRRQRGRTPSPPGRRARRPSRAAAPATAPAAPRAAPARTRTAARGREQVAREARPALGDVTAMMPCGAQERTPGLHVRVAGRQRAAERDRLVASSAAANAPPEPRCAPRCAPAREVATPYTVSRNAREHRVLAQHREAGHRPGAISSSAPRRGRAPAPARGTPRAQHRASLVEKKSSGVGQRQRPERVDEHRRVRRVRRRRSAAPRTGAAAAGAAPSAERSTAAAE